MAKTYDPNIVGDRFDKDALDRLHHFRRMKENNPAMYAEFIDNLRNLPASYGIAVNAMIRGDGATLATELGDNDLEYFTEAMIPALVNAFGNDGLKPIDAERSAHEFNRPLTVLNRMGTIVEAMETENAGRKDAINDAKTKMEADLRNKKRELKADKSYSRNPIKRWAHRRSEMKKFEASEKAKYSKFCREQQEQADKYNETIKQYHEVKGSGSLITGGDWVNEMERFANNYEQQKLFDTLVKTPLTPESRYYEDAQAIRKQVDLSRQIQNASQTRGSATKESVQKTVTIKNPTREILQKDE